LEALRAVAPDVRRVAVFYGARTGVAFARAARAAAAARGIELLEVPLDDLAGLARRTRERAQSADAYWLPADGTVAAPEVFDFLLRLSLQRRKPLLAFAEPLVRAGALAAVAPDYAMAGVQAAEAVRRIQSGERAGHLPVAPVRRTRLIVNQATARALGRDLPNAALRNGSVVP
jgi:putative ABC transport system substrate-binding protein